MIDSVCFIFMQITANLLKPLRFFFSFFFFFCGTGVELRASRLLGRHLYHLTHSTSPLRFLCFPQFLLRTLAFLPCLPMWAKWGTKGPDNEPGMIGQQAVPQHSPAWTECWPWACHSGIIIVDVAFAVVWWWCQQIMFICPSTTTTIPMINTSGSSS
jgi:hypothetical protein